jgi:hypothetical protein
MRGVCRGNVGTPQPVFIHAPTRYATDGDWCPQTDVETNLYGALGLAHARFLAGRLAESAQAYHHALKLALAAGEYKEFARLFG